MDKKVDIDRKLYRQGQKSRQSWTEKQVEMEKKVD